MTVRHLTATLPKLALTGDLDAEVTSIVYDSRKVVPGCAFVALRGTKVDGHDFIDAAIAGGATLIVAEQAPHVMSVAWLHLSNSRAALALLSAVFHEHPAKALDMAGITGTNGKTTIGFLVHHLMNAAQKRCGLIGTVFYDLGGQQIPATHTTPESLELQHHLADMRSNGCRAAVMEVSSHALDQDRALGISFKAGIFTNLTQDHLDYHGTLDAYFDAKALLFEGIAAEGTGTMIINADDLWGKKLITRFNGYAKMSRYGFGAGCDFRALNVRYDLTGTTFELEAKGRQFLVRTPLIGDFNVYNTLAALAAADAMGINFREAVASMKTAPQVPGRMERVSADNARAQVFVDYAHTPDALWNVLRTARALKPRRIITVFGCGGDRDKTKRPLMARAAEQGSDICVLTSDNPRSEDPQAIIDDASKGFTGKNYTTIADRREALKFAINNADKGDLVLLAGKGHEDYQEIDGVKHKFDDRNVARILLSQVKFAIGAQREEQQKEWEERQRQREERDNRGTAGGNFGGSGNDRRDSRDNGGNYRR